MPEVPISTRKTYDLFLNDVRAKELNVLPDEEVRDRIRIIRGTAFSDEEKAVARNQIVDSSLRMIPYAIKKARNLGIPQEELVGEAFQVINSCIDRFDPEHISPKTEDQVRWSSYVFASLEFKLRTPRSVVRAGEAFAIPVHIGPFVSAMRKARELFMQEESREPNQDEWYKRTLRFIDENRSSKAPMPNPQQFKDAERARFTGVARLGRKAYRGNVDTDTLSPLVGPVEETIVDPDADTFEEVANLFLEDEVSEALSLLNPRDRRVIELRFGLGLNEDGERLGPMTLEQVSSIFRLTKERIRQIEAKALRKLRHPAVSGKMKNYLVPPQEESKLQIIERQYGRDIDLIARRAISRLYPQQAAALFESLREGSFKNGRLDISLLGELLNPDEIAELIESEEQYFRFKSPRVIAQDIVNGINRKLKIHDFVDPAWSSIGWFRLKEKE